MKQQPQWWKEAIVYQIYPRSFQDSNGDGIGDLKGIIARLDYLQSLGIDVVWLNPIYGSPNDDNGYDISNYRDIMAEFGTLEDFDELLAGLHARGIRLIMDLVVNHSSDEHPWFIAARQSRDDPHRAYYHWWPAENGTPPYRWSVFDVNGSAWAYDEKTSSWYLHYFSVKQPDLRWENDALRKEIYDMMHFWFRKGIDGFRMDVITAISKDPSWPVISPETLEKEYGNFWPAYYASGPRLHEYLREMNDEVLRHYDCMTVAEGWGITTANALDFVSEDRGELNMLYHFEGMEVRHHKNRKTDPPYDLVAFKDVYTKWDRLFSQKGWGTVYLGNHDQSRMVSRWGNDEPAYWKYSSKMLTTFLLTMRGTPYYYAGDEIGMTSIKFQTIEEYQDINTINNYRRILAEGGDTNAFLEDEKLYSRDNGRTPFQWSNEHHAGFTSGTPWLKVNPNYPQVNADAQENDPGSPLNYFRNLTRLRKAHKVLVYGDYTLLDRENQRTYAFTREDGEQKILVLLNFSGEDASCNTGISLQASRLLISNYEDAQAGPESNDVYITLRPYEAQVILVS